MSKIPDSAKITDLNIPGAHDASTRFCQLGLFSSCQKLSVREMLDIGVRAFDLRVDGEIMVHSFTKCKSSRFGKHLTIYDITRDILNFLDIHPSESVFIFFKNDGKTDGKACLDLLINNIISKNPDKWFLENRFPLLGEVRGKTVLLNRIDSSVGIDFTRMPYQGGTKDTFAENFSTDGNNTVTVQDRYFLNPLKKWKNAVFPLLENSIIHSENLIINHLSTAGFPFIPRINSAYINRKFMNYSLSDNVYYGFIMADFQSIELTTGIIKTNFKI